MAVVFAFIFETAILVLFNIIKMLYVANQSNIKKRTSAKIPNYLTIIVFLFVSTGFLIMQSLFIYLLFAINDYSLSTSLSVSNFLKIFELDGFFFVFFMLFLSNLVTFYFSFIKDKTYLNEPVKDYFKRPIFRILLQQFIIIFPAIFLTFTKDLGVIIAVFLILLRTGLDFSLLRLMQKIKRNEHLKQQQTLIAPEKFSRLETYLKKFLL